MSTTRTLANREDCRAGSRPAVALPGWKALRDDDTLPLAESGLFDDATSILVYDQIPAEDRTPDYPPPDLG